MTRREALRYGTLGVAGVAGIGALRAFDVVDGGASAATYPSGPITLYSGYEAGGTTDILGRAVAEYSSDLLGVSVKLEFMPGASGMVAAKYLLTQPADGYKWYVRPHLDFELIALQQGMPVAFNDFTTIGVTGVGEYFIVVPTNSRFETIEDLISYARSNPGEVSYGSSGAGSAAHVASAKLGQEAGIEITHVPFEGGGPALEAVLGGHVDLLMVTAPRIKDHIVPGGRLRAIVCCGAKRSPQMPEIKTLVDLGYDVTLDLRHSVCVSADTSKEIVDKLRTSMKRAVQTPKYAKMIEMTGFRAEWIDHSEYDEWSAEGLEQYTPVMKRIGLLK